MDTLAEFARCILSLDSLVGSTRWITLSPNAVFAHNSFLYCCEFQMYSLHAVT